MVMGDRLVTATTLAAVDFEEVKAHLNVLHKEDDHKIRNYIESAIADIETEAGIVLCEQIRECTFSRFPARNGELVLPVRPATAVTSVSYYDTTGVLTVLADCQFLLTGFVGRILPPIDDCWPMTQATRAEPVVVRYTAGYGERADDVDVADVPKDIIGAIKLLVADRYENKGDDIRVKNGLPPTVMRVLYRHSIGTPA